MSIAGSIHEQAHRSPDAVAVLDGPVALTYAELDGLAHTVARRLADRGVRAEQAVAVAVARSWQLVAVMLGVLRHGAQLVPLDVQSPAERRRTILEDSSAALIIDEQQAIAMLAAGPAARPPAPRPPAAAPLVFFTSGTTGRPKGVLVRDAGVTRLTVPGYGGLRPGLRFAWLGNPAFDALNFEVWTPLMTGGTCVVVREEALADPHSLAATLQTGRVDTAFVTVSLFNVLAATLPECFAGVTNVLTGGEQLDAGVIRRWYAHNGAGGTVLHNVYGPTESTTFATCWAIPRDFTGDNVPIGRALPGTKTLVVAPGTDRIAAPGEVGELLLAGDGLAAGYLNRPQETARRFVRLPGHGAARFYRTGDMVRADEDGLLTFLGRADRQIKVRGFRVELDEVERAIAAHPAVRQVHVDATRDEVRGTNRLLAYVVPGACPDAAGADCDAAAVEEFERHLRAALPAYMRPHQVLRVERFPLTANGKVDTDALRACTATPWRRVHRDTGLTPPQRAVLALAAEILDATPSPVDTWLALGGDSLSALQFRFAVKRRWGVEIAQSAVLQDSLVSLADHITAGTAGSRYPAVPTAAGSRVAAATSEQQRMWLLQRRSPQSRAYDVDVAFRIAGPVDVAALRAALCALVTGRRALRTGFAPTPNGLTQRVGEPYDPWVTDDEAFTAPFDLADPRLLRARWRDGVLSLRTHHIAVDGWALNLLFADLSAAYAHDTLAAETFTMLDYARWQAEWFTRPEYLARRDALREYLGDADRTPQCTTAPAALLRRPIGPERTVALDRLCARLQMTRFEVLAAVFAWSLYTVTGQTHPRMAAPVSNRPLREFADTVGMFANTVPLPLPVDPNSSVAQHLSEAVDTVRTVLDHQDVAFADVAAPFDYLFVLENTDFAALTLPGSRVEPDWPTPAEAKCALTLSVVSHSDGLNLHCEYAEDRFSSRTATALLDALLQGIDAVVTERYCTPAELAASYRSTLGGTHSGETVPLAYRTIAEGFARQALQTPSATALRCADGSMTYAELAARSAALAGQLRAAHPEVDADGPCRIALFFEPSAEHVVALLALARLNVTAVPLDPAYPATLLRAVLTQVEPLCALLGPGCRERFAALGAQVRTRVVSVPDLLVSAVDEPVTHRSSRPLYTLFTSGSTGTPKAVEISDATLCNLLQWQRSRGELAAAALTQQFSMLSFDVSFQEIFTTLCGGGTLQLISPRWRHDIPELLDALETGGVQRIFLPYVALSLIAEHGVRLGKYPSQLREVITAGEQLLCTPVLRRWFAGLTDAVLFNHYGPTETHVITSLRLAGDPAAWPERPPIGRPVDNAQVRVVDAAGLPVPPGCEGELLLGGTMVTHCYPGAPELNTARFTETDRLWYHSGDRARFDRDGILHYVGRGDQQVKISGFRIELGQIETALLEHPDTVAAVVTADAARLTAHLQFHGTTPDSDELTRRLAERLPAYVRVDRFREIAQFPRTPSGKLDRAAVTQAPGHDLPRSPAPGVAVSALQARLAAMFEAVVGRPISPQQSFFAAGAGSLDLMRFQLRCATEPDLQFAVTDLFEHVTITALARHLGEHATIAALPERDRSDGGPVAVIGMAVRLPGAADLAGFWDLVRTAGSAIEHFDAADGLVGARSALEGMFDFDPAHFGISPRDAALMDPQQRHVLMSCVAALAHAGIGDPSAHSVGLVASCGENTYFQSLLHDAPAALPDRFALALHHEKDFLATRAAYLLGLTGPALSAQSACGSSLLGVHLAANMLRAGDADVMLVSAALIDPQSTSGYRHTANHIFSPDGNCRPFSDDAAGTLGGNGVATVVLKPLHAARRDGDRVYAVITGSAVNNDGATKMSYGAPSVTGQRDVIRAALRRAGRTGRDIGYVEAHGTGTRLGDPVEIRALSQALSCDGGVAPGSVALSSVKSQLGHLGAAAGLVGLIRATLSIQHGLLAPTLHFRSPNPEFGADWAPFHVPAQACPWPPGRPKVAGVSSFGIGGTNAHVILESEDEPADSDTAPIPCLMLSASSESALHTDATAIAAYLERQPQRFTQVLRHLQAGRPVRRWRAAAVCADAAQAVSWLRGDLTPVAVSSSECLAHPEPDAAELVRKWLAGGRIAWPAGSAQAPWDFPPPSLDTAPYRIAGHGGVQRLPEADWLHQPGWVRSRPAGAAARSSDRTLVVMAAAALDHEAISGLRTRYRRVVQVRAATGYGRRGPDEFDADPADAGSIGTVLAELDGAVDWLHALPLSLTGPVGHETMARARWACLDTPAALLQALRATGVGARVFWLSALARPVQGRVCHPEAGLLAGATEVTGCELPTSSCWLDLPGTDWRHWGPALLGLLCDSETEASQLVLRHGFWWRQAPVAVPRPTDTRPSFGRAGTHVVLGGTGGIGTAAADWLLAHTAAGVLLVSRSGAVPDSLAQWGSRVTGVAADLTAAAAGVLADTIARQAGPISGVVHAVGVPGGGLIAGRDPVAARAGTAAKLAGALVVEELIAGHRPEFAVWCSSMASQFGGAGQFDYAAANGLLDGFAQYRADDTETTVRIGINWDIWAQGGMATRVLGSDAGHQAHLAVGLSTAEGRRVFGDALSLQLPQILVSTTDFDVARDFYGTVAKPAACAGGPGERGGEPAGASTGELAGVLATQLRAALHVEQLDPQDCLYDLGADSLTLLELTDRIEAAAGVQLDISELSHQVSLAEILDRVAAKALGPAGDLTVEVWQEGAGRDVLCLVHPVGGDVQSYRDLVSAVPADLTVCLIADPGLKSGRPTGWTVTERAAAYDAALQARFPCEQWRVRLAGWSFGALVAVEMAAARETAGRPVEALYLLDPPPADGDTGAAGYDADQLAEVFARELGDNRGTRTGRIAADYAKRLAACCEANLHSMIGHLPARLNSTPTLLWRARRTPVGSGPDTWRRHLPVHAVLTDLDTTHYDIVHPPHAGVIAAAITSMIGELNR